MNQNCYTDWKIGAKLATSFRCASAGDWNIGDKLANKSRLFNRCFGLEDKGMLDQLWVKSLFGTWCVEDKLATVTGVALLFVLGR